MEASTRAATASSRLRGLTARVFRPVSGVLWLRLSVALVALLISLLAQWSAPGNGMLRLGDEWLRDHVVRWQAQHTPEERLTLVDIDEASLSEIGAWPWPRERLADLVELLLGDYAAQAVALDLVMPAAGNVSGDQRLAALAEHGPLVLAQAFDYVLRPRPLREGKLAAGLPATAVGASVVPQVATGYIANHALLNKARCTGNIGFVPDADGAIRRLPLLTALDEQVFPGLSLALLMCAARGASDDGLVRLDASDANHVLHQLMMSNALDSPLWRVPFSRAESAYLSIPAAEVLNLRVPHEAFAGRLVLIGSSSLGLSDRVATPLAPSTSGLLVHASALTALLDWQSGVAAAPWPGRWLAMLFVLLVVVLAVLAFPRLSATRCTVLLLCAMAVWLLCAACIVPHDDVFNTSAPLLSLAWLLITAIPLEWRVSQLASARLLTTLSQYVAQPVLDELLKSGLRDPLQPTQLQVTTLVADMEDYTALVRDLTLEEAVILTRGFLDCLTRPVLNCHGTLDKYTGDGLVAFWGAPLMQADHADLALDAALGILEEVRQLNVRRQRRGQPSVRVRIGVESGLAVAGDLGTPFRSTYTAVGDSVNVAARLQEMARDYPCDIIVGMGAAALSRRHTLNQLGAVQLRGRPDAEVLYTPCSL